MKNVLLYFLIITLSNGCAFLIGGRTHIKKIDIYATDVSAYTFKPIYKEYFETTFFPNSVRYNYSGKIKRIRFYPNRKDSIYREIENLQYLGHIDSVRYGINMENIRIRCRLEMKRKTIDLWINHKAKSCIIGDSVYLCSPVLVRQLCYFVPETFICDYVSH